MVITASFLLYKIVELLYVHEGCESKKETSEVVCVR